MKRHRTESLETAPEFRARFNGAFEAARKAGSRLGFNRHSARGKWEASLVAWKKMKMGHINASSVEALVKNHADKFSYFDKNGGRLPMGL